MIRVVEEPRMSISQHSKEFWHSKTTTSLILQNNLASKGLKQQQDETTPHFLISVIDKKMYWFFLINSDVN